MLWIGWGLAFVVIEGIALFNSSRGDTLSEHAWAWLGVGSYQRRKHTVDTCIYCSTRIARPAPELYGEKDPLVLGPGDRPSDFVHIDGYDRDRYAVHVAQPGFVTPRWTLRVARTLLVSFLVWLTLHLTTGWV